MPNFNSNIDSPLFEREEYQGLASRLIKRTPVYLCSDNNSFGGDNPNNLSPFDSWLKDNVVSWTYIYCLSNSQVHRNNFQRIDGYETGLVCFAYPNYSTNTTGEIRLMRSEAPEDLWFAPFLGTAFWARVRHNDTLGANAGYPRSSDIVTVKLSPRPPFDTVDFIPVTTPVTARGANYTISGNNLILWLTSLEQQGVQPPNAHGGRLMWGDNGVANTPDAAFRSVYVQARTGFLPNPNSLRHLSEPYTLSKRLSFDVSEITSSSNHNRPELNPKLLGSDFYQLRLESADGQYFEYDAQKLGRQTFRLAYTELLTPDVTRGYLRVVQPDNDGVYPQYSESDWTGLVYSSDNSMIFSSSAWSEFISNNKNFFQMAQMQKDFSDAKLTDTNRANSLLGLRGMMDNHLAQNGFGATSAQAIGDAGIPGISGRVNNTRWGFEGNALQYQKKMLSADNIKAAPNNVQNASGNAYFTNFVTGQQLFISELEALPHELAMANEDMHINGYAYGRVGQVRDFMNTRVAFNFIQAEVQVMGGIGISNEIREDIKRRFAEGIRFWHQDTVDYNVSNHEMRLE